VAGNSTRLASALEAAQRRSDKPWLPVPAAYRVVMSALQVVGSHPDGSILTVWVVPGARRTEIVGYHSDSLRIRVAAPPERGRANRAVAAHLSKQFGARVSLVGGAASRRKRFVVLGVSADILAALIDDILD